MHIDCDTCTVRGPGCGDCVVTVLLGLPAPREHAPDRTRETPREPRRRHPLPRARPGTESATARVRWSGAQADGTALPAGLTHDDERALAVLAAAGLVPGLTRQADHRQAG